MPKQKTKKIAAKRFKITKTGKVLRKKQNARHLRANKTKSQIRRFKKSVEVTGKQARWIKNMMNG